jgi:uncharacterized protein YcbX
VVGAVHVYPVKSLGGGPVQQAQVELAGLRGDRRWMVVDPDGDVVTARKCHVLLSVTARTQGDVLTLSAEGRPALEVRTPAGPPDVEVGLSRLDRATSAGFEADAWVSDLRGRPARLVWLDDPARRPVGTSHGGTGTDPLSLADAGPLLLTTTASLRQLDAWVAAEREQRGEPATEPLSMLRFRPNVVVDGDLEPFVEDRWRRLRIGEVEYRFAEHCDRCVMTTLDPLTQTGGKEPLRTLARYRQWDHKVWFGVRLIPLGTGLLRLGDAVEPRA